MKDSSGNLKLLDYVSTNKYETTMDVSGEYTFVVKTAYSIYKMNMSNGKSVKVNVSVNSVIIPEPEDPTIDSDTNTDTTNTPSTNG